MIEEDREGNLAICSILNVENLELGRQLSVVNSVLAGHLPKHMAEMISLFFSKFVYDANFIIKLVRVIDPNYGALSFNLHCGVI